MRNTKAWLSVQSDIKAYEANPLSSDEVARMPAVRAARAKRSRRTSEVKGMFDIAAYNRAVKAGKSKAEAKRIARGSHGGGGKKKRAAKKSTSRPKARKTSAKPRRKSRRKSRAKSSKPKRRKKRSQTRTVREKTVRTSKRGTSVVRIVLTQPRARSRKRTTSKRRRKNPVDAPIDALTTTPSFDTNPVDGGAFGGLFSNPASPFTAASMGNYLTAVGGVGFGALAGNVLDRWIATRKPAEVGGREAVGPWYGAAAAAAQRRRPDAWRLFGQGALAVGAMAGAYWTRNMRFLPWMLGGTSVGGGVNLFLMLANGYLMPAIFKVDDPSAASLGNRLYPQEQADVQDAIDKVFEAWPDTIALSNQQQETPIISAPGGTVAGRVRTLGKGRSGTDHTDGVARARSKVVTGALGGCSGCGGSGGSCYSDCPTLDCAPCRGDGSRDYECIYEVEAGDDFEVMVSAAGADMALINEMNGGDMYTTYWVPGNRVKLPFVMCKMIQERMNGGIPSDAVPVATPSDTTPVEGSGIPSGPSGGEPLDPGTVVTATMVTPMTGDMATLADGKEEEAEVSSPFLAFQGEEN